MDVAGSITESWVATTIFFADPFWVAVVELHNGDRVGAARYVFGAEPTDPEVTAFVAQYGLALLQQAAVRPRATGDSGVPMRPANPKRAAREAAHAAGQARPSTKAQEALRLQIEARKAEHQVERRAARDAHTAYKREVARQKARERHKGH